VYYLIPSIWVQSFYNPYESSLLFSSQLSFLISSPLHTVRASLQQVNNTDCAEVLQTLILVRIWTKLGSDHLFLTPIAVLSFRIILLTSFSLSWNNKIFHSVNSFNSISVKHFTAKRTFPLQTPYFSPHSRYYHLIWKWMCERVSGRTETNRCFQDLPQNTGCARTTPWRCMGGRGYVMLCYVMLCYVMLLG
jgi:hypothetical protein